MNAETLMHRAMICCALTAGLGGAASAHALALGDELPPTVVSGTLGLESTVAKPDGTTHAIYGITSRERSDDPCLVTIRKEHIANRASDADFPRDWCGSKRATSSTLTVEYQDNGERLVSERIFVTGVRVCMNRSGDKVKGLQLRGREITSDGRLAAITVGPHTGGGLARSETSIREPQNIRTNCVNNDTGWRRWTECVEGALATAAILHFDGGDMPRSLVGIQLVCRPLVS